MEDKELYSLLKNKQIIEMLNGDTTFGKYEFEDGDSITIRMPYLSGPDLCSLSSTFGLKVTYAWGEAKSRWMYLYDLFDYCIKHNKCSELLSFMFKKERFQKMLSGHSPKEIDAAYEKIIETVKAKISGMLYFGGHELITVGNIIFVHKIGAAASVSAPRIKVIDRDYVRNMLERALDDVEQGNYDSAINHSRTLLEEVFCYVLEQKSITPNESGNVNVLYSQVKKAYNMHKDINADQRIKTLLSGINSIVSAIADMRNKDSDAHGVGSKRVRIEERHARLAVNSAVAMADFILSVAENQNTNLVANS